MGTLRPHAPAGVSANGSVTGVLIAVMLGLVGLLGGLRVASAADSRDVDELRERVDQLRGALREAELELDAALAGESVEETDSEPGAAGDEEGDSLAESAELRGIHLGPVAVGGAIRASYVYGDYPGGEGPSRGSDGGDFELDTFRLDLSLDLGDLFGYAQYRWYTGVNFLHSAYVGYRFPDESELQAGVHQVPFGMQTYLGNSWFFQLPFYVGLEDDYDLGLQYVRNDGPWGFKAAYYAQDEGNYFGASRDSARFSYDVVRTGDTSRNYAGLVSNNKERHQVNLRGTYTWQHTAHASTEVGLSGQVGQIVNSEVDNGRTVAGAVHLKGQYGPWGLRVQATGYDYDIHRVDGLNEGIIIMGAYDYPYEVAARAVIGSAGLSYTWTPGGIAWLDDVTFYVDYSLMAKDGSDVNGRFNDAQQAVVGGLWHYGGWYVYTDVAFGSGAPFVGFRTDQASGEDNFVYGLSSNRQDDWLLRLNLNIGYYW